jgi:hypothetical protein
MKRQSKAEEALTRQLKELSGRIEDERAAMEGQRIKIATLVEVMRELEDAIDYQRRQRELASQKQKERTSL